MKRHTLTAIFALLVIFGAKNALADQIYTGLQTQGGTITSGSCTTGSGAAAWLWIETSSAMFGNASTNRFWQTGGGCFNIATASIPFSAGDTIGICTGGSSCNDPITYSLNGSGGTLAGIPAISFDIPAAGGTAPNFSSWRLLGSNLDTSGALYRFDVVYSLLGGGTTYDDFNISNFSFSPAALVIPKSQLLAFGSEWEAQGFLYATTTTSATLAIDDPADAIATTSVILFNIGDLPSSTAPGSPNTPGFIGSVCPSAPPIFQITGSLPYFMINNPIPSIESGGCVILLSGFEMSEAQTADINSRYNNAATAIGSKPPLGYFTLIVAALGAFSSGTSTISLLTPSSTAALSPILSPLDAGLAGSIGLLAAFWLLRRLKHIQPT